jgi:hypothetical protein
MFISTPTQQVSTGALALTVGVVAWAGGRPEKIGVTLIAAAWIITPFVELRQSWYQPQWGILAVDLLTLAGLVGMSLAYKRRWPICASGFQALAVLTHLAFLVSPHALYRGYLYANFAIGYLLLGSVLGGVALEARPTRGFIRRALYPLSGPSKLRTP